MRTRLARKWPALALATALLGGALPSHASATGTADAQCTLAGTTGSRSFGSYNEYAQTFTASKSGKLLTAEMTGIYRGAAAGAGDDVGVWIYAAGAGGPTGAALAAATIPGTSIPTGATTLTANFPAETAAYLDAGQQYALSLSTTDPLQNTWDVGADPCAGNAYYYGHSGFVPEATLDFGFKVYLGPANDDFSKPQALAGAGASANGTTAGGTREVDEPDHYVTDPPDSDFWVGDHSVWYTWAAPSSGQTTLETCTAAIDSILAVYTGSSLAALSRVADNNNSGACPAGTYGSALPFEATAGTTYRIAVGDAGGLRESTFTLNVIGALDPQTQIDSGPSGPTNDSTPTFSFSSNKPGSTFECKLDGGSFSSCTSPDTLGALTDGSHTFQVRAIDQAANTDATPSSQAFTVDTVPPETTITTGPSGPTNDSTPTFSFSSNKPGSTFECKLDGGSFSSCTSPDTLGALTDGSHTFQVRAIDQAANTDATPSSQAFTVDTVPPETTITKGLSGKTTDRTPTFKFKSDVSGATFECSLDGKPLKPCTSPKTYKKLSRGKHKFEVEATDRAGNTDPSTAKIKFKLVKKRR